MKLKYLPQLLIIVLTLGIYLVSAACGQSEEPSPILADLSNPTGVRAETALWGTEYARATEAGTIVAEATNAAETRKARTRTPTISRTPTASQTPTPSRTPTRRPTVIPSATDDPNRPTLTFPEFEGTRKAQRAEQEAKTLKALIVLGGPPDVPGWDGPSQVTTATPTELVYYLDQDFLMDKLPEIYGDLMPKYGWTRTQANATMMKFTKEGRTAAIMFSLEPDRRVKVAIVIS